MAENKEIWERKKAIAERELIQKKAFAERELTQKGYCRISVVGQGAFSVVLRVWDESKRCFWACKVSTISEMAEKEAEMLQRIQHPVFPKYEGSWKSHGYFFLLMEYISGSNIYKLCKQRKQFAQRQAVHIAMELARGLLFLHEREVPILFRDIKPENVMLRQDGRVKLVDLGCAALINEKQHIAGSKGYSAPEQFGKSQNAGVECDVYALGMLLWFMLAGPEAGGSEKGLGDAGHGKRVPKGLRRLVGQATRQECHGRIPDMRIFIKHLEIYEKKYSFKRMWESIKSVFLREEIVDFYYVQNIRRGIDI